MAPVSERTPQERETLIFPTPQEAQGWLEAVGEKLIRQEGLGVKRKRELVSEELKRQFESHGEGVGMIIRPWEHTPAEHQEVQQLVDLAFAQDLPAALRAARNSGTYPRNIDLFHDVLTTEMYELVREHGLGRQPVSLALVVTVGSVVLLVLILLFLFVA